MYRCALLLVLLLGYASLTSSSQPSADLAAFFFASGPRTAQDSWRHGSTHRSATAATEEQRRAALSTQSPVHSPAGSRSSSPVHFDRSAFEQPAARTVTSPRSSLDHSSRQQQGYRTAHHRRARVIFSDDADGQPRQHQMQSTRSPRASFSSGSMPSSPQLRPSVLAAAVEQHLSQHRAALQSQRPSMEDRQVLVEEGPTRSSERQREPHSRSTEGRPERRDGSGPTRLAADAETVALSQDVPTYPNASSRPATLSRRWSSNSRWHTFARPRSNETMPSPLARELATQHYLAARQTELAKQWEEDLRVPTYQAELVEGERSVHQDAHALFVHYLFAMPDADLLVGQWREWVTAHENGTAQWVAAHPMEAFAVLVTFCNQIGLALPAHFAKEVASWDSHVFHRLHHYIGWVLYYAQPVVWEHQRNAIQDHLLKRWDARAPYLVHQVCKTHPQAWLNAQYEALRTLYEDPHLLPHFLSQPLYNRYLLQRYKDAYADREPRPIARSTPRLDTLAMVHLWQFVPATYRPAFDAKTQSWWHEVSRGLRKKYRALDTHLRRHDLSLVRQLLLSGELTPWSAAMMRVPNVALQDLLSVTDTLLLSQLSPPSWTEPVEAQPVKAAVKWLAKAMKPLFSGVVMAPSVGASQGYYFSVPLSSPSLSRSNSEMSASSASSTRSFFFKSAASGKKPVSVATLPSCFLPHAQHPVDSLSSFLDARDAEEQLTREAPLMTTPVGSPTQMALPSRILSRPTATVSPVMADVSVSMIY